MQPKLPPPRGPLPGPSYQPPSAPPVPVHLSGAVAGNLGRSSGQLPKVERGLQTSNQFLRTPIVRYSSVMRVGKQHPMRISLTGANGDVEPVKPQSLSGGFDPPILVQVTIPGALVTPTHQIIPLSGGDANFIVQPISSGKLKGAKVEFLSQGRKISEIPLPIKANKGRLAKWLLALGILIPLLINVVPELSYQPQLIDPDKRTHNLPAGPGGKPLISEKLQQFGGIGGPGAGNKSNSKEKTSPTKSIEKTPEKAKEKQAEKTPGKPSAFQTDELSNKLLPVLLLGLQGPGSNKDTQPPLKNSSPQTPQPSKSLSPTASKDSGQNPSNNQSKQPLVDKVESFPLASTAALSENQVSPAGTQPGNTADPGRNDFAYQNKSDLALPTYRGEDAIWSWVRHKLHHSGYPTKLLPSKDNPDQISRFLTVDRNYEITGESKKELTTSRMAAVGLYYLEPALRWLYRVFIQFPKDNPLADLGFGLFFIALGVIAWVLTSPNRKKIKGAVMDIRLAS
jgi:hypothetical protein